MALAVTCTIVTQNRNESKAGMVKNLALEHFDHNFKVVSSEPFFRDETQWFLKLDAGHTFTDHKELIVDLLRQCTKVFERFSVSGPIYQEDGRFAAFFVHFMRTQHGARVHHCLEEFHFMVMSDEKINK